MGERRDLRDLLRDTDFEQRRIIDDLSSYREDEQPDKDITRDIKRGGVSDFFKNLFVGLFLVAIVIGSFWISFLVGKRVLVPPVKNIPSMELPRPITRLQASNAEAVRSFEGMKESFRDQVSNVTSKFKGAAPAKETVAKPATVTSPAPAPVPVKKDQVKIFHYKVVGGIFASQNDAQILARKLTNAGFPQYVKKVSGMWHVQVGAFETKSQALSLISRLKAKGFSPRIVYE